MSRSRRKQPFCAMTCADSEKQAKKQFHRAMRRHQHMECAKGEDCESVDELEHFNSYTMPKDGKAYLEAGNYLRESLMRK